MRKLALLALLVSLVVATQIPGSATAADQDVHSSNMTHIGSAGNPGTTNSDLAFSGNLLIAGSYSGTRIIDISDPTDPKQLSTTKCNGGQGDVSVWRNLLFVSVEYDQTKPTCSEDVPIHGYEPPGFEGIRIFDIADPSHPKLVSTVQTDCGSHTNTLVPDVKHGAVYLYIESYPLTGHDQNCNFHNYISVVKVPLANPKKAAVVSKPDVSPAQGCHDVQVFLPLKVAAAACLTEGQIWDISDIAHPKVIQHLYNPFISIWHSAGFSWDGKTLAFGDENQSYQACMGPDEPYGAIWFYTFDPKTKTASDQPAGYYSLPRVISGDPSTECTAHNFDMIPGIKRDILVSAFYSGGATVVDFTDPTNPKEIAYYQIGGDAPADEWSTYWYNGYIYSNDINRGLDVFRLRSPLVKGATDLPYLNPQTQE